MSEKAVGMCVFFSFIFSIRICRRTRPPPAAYHHQPVAPLASALPGAPWVLEMAFQLLSPARESVRMLAGVWSVAAWVGASLACW
jgi:hypothetical protein